MDSNSNLGYVNDADQVKCRSDAEQVSSLISALNDGREPLHKRLRRETASLLSKTTNRICLILQILMMLTCTVGAINLLIVVFYALDWYFAITYYIHAVVIYAVFFVLLWIGLVVAIMMTMGMVLTASKMKRGGGCEVLDVFCTFKKPYRSGCLRIAVAVAMLISVSVALMCFAIYGVKALAIYSLGYFGDLGYYSMFILHIPTLAAFVCALLLGMAALFFAAPIILRYPCGGAIRAARASLGLFKGRKKETVGLMLRWTLYFALSLLSIGVVTLIFVIPGALTSYAVYCDTTIDENLK